MRKEVEHNRLEARLAKSARLSEEAVHLTYVCEHSGVKQDQYKKGLGT